MAHAETTVHLAVGVEHGSTNTCQRCQAGQLIVQDGHDVTDADGNEGFVETYECTNCKRRGTYKRVSKTGQERYEGVCADL